MLTLGCHGWSSTNYSAVEGQKKSLSILAAAIIREVI